MVIGKFKITHSDKEKIQAAVVAAEKKTIGEIVPVILTKTPFDHSLGLISGIFFALGFFPIFASFAMDIWGHYLWPLQLLFFSAGFAIIGIDSVRRFLLGKKRLNALAEKLAIEAFYREGLYKTKKQTGVLIFASLADHRVVILGDEGINNVCEINFWDNERDKLIAKIKENQLVEGMCEVIADVGAKLSEHFPYEENDTNELKDNLVIT